MKTLINTLFLILLWAGSAGAFPQGFVAGVTSGGAASVVYLLNEGFEGVGLPTNWSVASGDAILNWDDILSGDESLSFIYVTSPTVIYTAALSSASAHPYFGIKINIPTLANGVSVLRLRSSSSNKGDITVDADGSLVVAPSGGTPISSSAGVVTAGVDIFIRVEAIKGTGSDSVLTVSTSSNGTSWTQRATSTDGTNTSDFVRGAFVLTSDLTIFREIRAANEPFNM